MGPFAPCHERLAAFLEEKRRSGEAVSFPHAGPVRWPADRRRNLVLAEDTAVELGHPRDLSAAFLYWLEDPARLDDGRITVVGPDLPALVGRQASFGRIVAVGVEGFDGENSFDRYQEMDLLRYDLHLSGYMMRGASQFQREWSRVSRTALDRGFSFRMLGGALIQRLKTLPYVRSVEVVFVTSSREDVFKLQAIAADVLPIVGAMNKMATETDLDCTTCEYQAVCSEVAALRAMRRALQKKKGPAHA